MSDTDNFILRDFPRGGISGFCKRGFTWVSFRIQINVCIYFLKNRDSSSTSSDSMDRFINKIYQQKWVGARAVQGHVLQLTTKTVKLMDIPQGSVP